MTTWTDVSDAISTWSGASSASTTFKSLTGYVAEGYIVDDDYVVGGSVGISWTDGSDALSTWSGAASASTTWSPV